MEAHLSPARAPGPKLRALFDAYAERAEQGRFRVSCPSGAVCLDLEAEMEALRAKVASTFDAYVDAVARHVEVGSPRENRAFAQFVLTAIQGAWIRSRAERSGAPFRQAGAFLAALAAFKKP